MSTPESESPWYREGWPSLAPAAALVAREHRVTCGYHRKRSSGSPSIGARPFRGVFRQVRPEVGHRFSLIERPGGDCIFWDKSAGCTVYPARPVQCQTWPFWPENVESPEDWDHVRSVCPGSGHGRVYTVDEIVSSISRHEDE